jgi:aspartate/methionine/tyrosine aminotransferase
MRLNIVHPGAGELHYEIRGIVEFAKALQATGIDITWENIGDPIAKGEQVPKWIRELIVKEVKKNESYGYSPTKGLQDARQFLSDQRARQGKAQLDPENVLFFNGLGDAINKLYTWLNPDARVMGPNPAYPTHAAIEAAHGHSPHITYGLHSDRGWLPDMEEVRRKVSENPQIAGLLIINPDNPTGAVYPQEILKEFVAIAKEYDLFLIADEIYSNLSYVKGDFTPLAELADGVPIVVMRGLSKEIPWPGSRCGWAEFYNVDKDKDFRRYIQSIEEAKMAEVCSTTLPQTVFPAIFGDKRYRDHLYERRAIYKARAEKAAGILNESPSLKVIQPKGAFYLVATFTPEFMKKGLDRPAANAKAQRLLDQALADIPEDSFDKRFCHYLLASTGICTVPLTTGFNGDVHGFRMTLLEADPAVFTRTLNAIKDFCE